MMPAVSATLSRSMNWSNGAVASSRHSPSGAMVARADAGSEQYGPRSQSPRLWNPKKLWVYQKNPTIVVSTTAATAISSRLRSSCRWSTSDMVPSGLTCDAASTRIELLEDSGGLHGLANAMQTYRRGLTPRPVGRRAVRPVACPGGCSGRGIGGVDTLRGDRGSGPAACVRLGVGLHLLDLGLEDPHRLAQRTGRIRKLLGAEEQNEDGDDDDPVPGL